MVTNIVLVVIYAAYLKPAPALSVFHHARVRTMAAAMIALVMLVYALLLSRVENPHGLGKLSVIAAHYVAPPIYLIWWAATLDNERPGLWDIPLMVAPSVAYMAYVLIHGYVMGTYPYAMLNADRLSTPSMILHGLGMLLALIAACALFIILGRWLAARSPAKPIN